MEAWSPLMQGKLLDNQLIKEIADKHGKSVAQVILRWGVQHGVITIPKSTKEHRIIENVSIFDFELTGEEMDQIDAMNQNHRIGPDPDNVDFNQKHKSSWNVGCDHFGDRICCCGIS